MGGALAGPTFAFAFLLAAPLLGLVRQTRTQPERLLEHPLRARIVSAVQDHPGLLFARLRALTECSPGTLQHHLRLLAQARLVDSERRSRRHHVFPHGMDPQMRRWLSMFARHRGAGALLHAMAREGGISKDQASRELGLSRKALGTCIRKLREAGLVHPHGLEDQPRLLATPLGRTALHRLEGGPQTAPSALRAPPGPDSSRTGALWGVV